MSKPKHPKDEPKEEKPEGTPPAQPPMVALSLEEFTALESERDQARQQAKESFDGWQRERADFLNYKRRIERDQAQMEENAAARIIKKYLAVLDDIERALKTRPTEGAGAAWAEGVELIARKLQTILDNEGVKPVAADGQFDPNLHEAVTFEDHPERKSGEIIEVLQQGYKIGDRVIRPAQVRVAR